ncbi:MAG: hypothetical protein IPJ84_16705 [Bdellovibrionales bacterium]|nr:hypothetical protein [Bdellovibrionales bacterium]
MNRFKHLQLIVGAIALNAVLASVGHAYLCDASKQFCGDKGGYSGGSGGAPTRGSKIRLNPAVIPLDQSFGGEFLYFDNSVDFAIVKGLGRIGAAISPSNSEETFFGPPGVEVSSDFLTRHQEKHKYPSQKLTLATAFGLLNNKRSGLSRFEINLGVMGKYNRKTEAANAGGGLSGVAGPFTFGYSLYRDETDLEMIVTRYMVETYSIGAFLGPLVLDYSNLRMYDEYETILTSMITGTVLLSRVLITASVRNEHSSRPEYVPATDSLEYNVDKQEVFGGVQFGITRNIMLGAFYNYYLMREASFGVTIFL